MKTDQITRQKAVRKVLSDLNKTKDTAMMTESLFGFRITDNANRSLATSTAAAFMADMNRFDADGLPEHLNWDLYNRAVGIVKGETATGRAQPVKSNPNSSGANTRMALAVGSAYIAEKKGISYCPQLNLAACRTDRERAKLILRSEIEDQIKMDLLDVLIL